MNTLFFCKIQKIFFFIFFLVFGLSCVFLERPVIMMPLTFSECDCEFSTHTKDMKNLLFVERMSFNLLSTRIETCLDRVFDACTQKNVNSILNFRLTGETYLNLKRTSEALIEQKQILFDCAEACRNSLRISCIHCYTEFSDMHYFQHIRLKSFFSKNKRRFLDILYPYFNKYGKRCSRNECVHCIVYNVNPKWLDEIILTDFIIEEAIPNESD